MESDEIMVDVVYRNLNQDDVRIIAASQALYSFIYEWRERIIRASKEGLSYDGDALRTDFHESMSQHRISELFD